MLPAEWFSPARFTRVDSLPHRHSPTAVFCENETRARYVVKSLALADGAHFFGERLPALQRLSRRSLAVITGAFPADSLLFAPFFRHGSVAANLAALNAVQRAKIVYGTADALAALWAAAICAWRTFS
jgi:hypothetical protein